MKHQPYAGQSAYAWLYGISISISAISITVSTSVIAPRRRLLRAVCIRTAKGMEVFVSLYWQKHQVVPL